MRSQHNIFSPGRRLKLCAAELPAAAATHDMQTYDLSRACMPCSNMAGIDALSPSQHLVQHFQSLDHSAPVPIVGEVLGFKWMIVVPRTVLLPEAEAQRAAHCTAQR